MQSSRLTPELTSLFTESGSWQDHFLDDYVAHAARTFPDKVAVVDRGRAWTFLEVETLVNRTASMLKSLGVNRGEVVSWQLPNWIESVAIHHATARIGAVSNPIVAIYREREVGFILAQAKSRVFVVPQTFRNFDYESMASRFKHKLPDLHHVIGVGGNSAAEIPRFDDLIDDKSLAPAQFPERSANDIVLLLYTSGTTADPKGVMHSHNTLDYENRSIIEVFSLSQTDGVFMPSPLTHITGLLYGIQLPFMLGCKVVLQDVWNAEAAVKLVTDYGCTFTVGATPFLHGMLTHSNGESPLRVFACGGADVPPDLILRATAVLGGFFTRIYGSTEFPTAITSAPGDSIDKCATTDGREIAAAKTRIVDEAGQEVPDGTEGELQLFGPELFLGYLDESLNEDAFSSDGWFLSGDLASRDSDGFVRITGRKKDIILRGGENISAKEIEDLFYKHQKVREVAIVGMPDPVMVEKVCAFVVLNEGQSVSLDEITTFLRAQGIANQKLPERLVIVGDLPRTASGKIQKFRLRDQLTPATDGPE